MIQAKNSLRWKKEPSLFWTEGFPGYRVRLKSYSESGVMANRLRRRQPENIREAVSVRCTVISG